MMDSDDQPIALAPHLTWIHNYPKCDSCIILNGRGHDYHHSVEIAPFPHHPPDHQRSSSSVAGPSRDAVEGMRLLPSRNYQTFSPDDEKTHSTHHVDRGDGALPQINSRLDHVSNRNGNMSKQGSAMRDSQVQSPVSSKFLPDISHGRSVDGSRRSRRLSKSLDLSNRRRHEIESLSISLPSLPSTSMSHYQGTTAESSSTPSLVHNCVSDATVDEEILLTGVSLENQDSEEEDENKFSIDPFPFQTDQTPYESDFEPITQRTPSPLPQTKKKRKKKKEQPPPPQRRRYQKPAKPYVKPKRPVNLAALRRHEQEIAKRHPVKKQFLYSTVLESELQSYIPPRIPGGKLKPVYRRSNQTGDVLIPMDPIRIEYAQLKTEEIAVVESPWAMAKRRHQEALQAFLLRKKKLQKHVDYSLRKNKRRVRFVLPPGHITSASEDETSSDIQQDQESNESGESEQFEGNVEKDTDINQDGDVHAQNDIQSDHDAHGHAQHPVQENNDDNGETTKNVDQGDGAIPDNHPAYGEIEQTPGNTQTDIHSTTRQIFGQLEKTYLPITEETEQLVTEPPCGTQSVRISLADLAIMTN